jgi:hypothetical protein
LKNPILRNIDVKFSKNDNLSLSIFLVKPRAELEA